MRTIRKAQVLKSFLEGDANSYLRDVLKYLEESPQTPEVTKLKNRLSHELDREIDWYNGDYINHEEILEELKDKITEVLHEISD